MKQNDKIVIPLHKIYQIEPKIWKKIKYILPIQTKNTKRGRPRCDDCLIMCGIDYRLKAGCQWNKIPTYYGSPSTIHRRFQEWVQIGLFQKLWELQLIEYDMLVQLNLEYQLIDGAMTKSPLGGDQQEKVLLIEEK